MYSSYSLRRSASSLIVSPAVSRLMRSVRKSHAVEMKSEPGE
jgi:hypothetical protein